MDTSVCLFTHKEADSEKVFIVNSIIIQLQHGICAAGS
jgi:hypothetical protein